MKLGQRTLAMVLAGGRVDELNVLTYYRPKSAVPFGGFARIIDFPLTNLMQSGLEKVAILSQFRSYSLINHIGIGAAWDMIGRNRGISILPPSTGHASSSWYKGSADSVYQNLDFVTYHDPEYVLILSGDHVYNMDYRAIIEYHREKDADMTLACLEVPREEANRFGVASIDEEDGAMGGRVCDYAEKPADPQFQWASLTVFCFKTKVLKEVLERNARQDRSFEFGRDIIPRLLREEKKIYGFKFYGYWGYTRTIAEYWQTSQDLLGRRPKIDLEGWGIRTNLEHRDIRDCQPLKVGSQAELVDSLIYNGCRIEGHVERSIIFPGCHVQKGAVVKDSVLFFNNHVGRSCHVEKVVSDVNTSLGEGCRVGASAGEGAAITVLGWNNNIPPQTSIGAGCTVHPALEGSVFRPSYGPGEIVR